MKNKFLFVSRALMFVLAATGTFLEINKYGWHMLMYYTVLSNLLVTCFAAYLLYLMATDKDWTSPKVLRLKAGVTMSIMITCVIYHFMLLPIADDIWRLENILCHYLTPLYFFLDTLLLDAARQYKRLEPLIWTLVPLLYLVFALFNGLVLKIPIPDAKDSPFAYFFLNVPKYGWAYVLQWSVTIFCVYLIAGYLFAGVKWLRWKK